MRTRGAGRLRQDGDPRRRVDERQWVTRARRATDDSARRRRTGNPTVLLRRQDAAPRGGRLPHPRQEGQHARSRARAGARPRRTSNARSPSGRRWSRTKGPRRRRRQGARPDRRGLVAGRRSGLRRGSARAHRAARWRWPRRSTGRAPPRRRPRCSTTCSSAARPRADAAMARASVYLLAGRARQGARRWPRRPRPIPEPPPRAALRARPRRCWPPARPTPAWPRSSATWTTSPATRARASSLASRRARARRWRRRPRPPTDGATLKLHRDARERARCSSRRTVHASTGRSPGGWSACRRRPGPGSWSSSRLAACCATTARPSAPPRSLLVQQPGAGEARRAGQEGRAQPVPRREAASRCRRCCRAASREQFRERGEGDGARQGEVTTLERDGTVVLPGAERLARQLPQAQRRVRRLVKSLSRAAK